MNEKKIISKIVNISEKLHTDKVSQKELLEAFDLIASVPHKNLNVYTGYLLLYYFFKFKEIPPMVCVDYNITEDQRFRDCISILSGAIFPSSKIGTMFLDILSISDEQSKLRDILIGTFFCSMWNFINIPANFEMAIKYGVEITKSAFSLDNFDPYNKIKLDIDDAKVISLAGSGKKRIKMINISSLSAIITVAVGKAIHKNIIVEKTVSRATSSLTGSSDIFESVGVNLNIPVSKMAEISAKTGLGVFNIGNIVPRLNHIYDGRLHNAQIFAGIVGGAAIVCPVEANLINYGLSRGSNELCLAILEKIYPHKNIFVLSGKNSQGNSTMDQVSVVGETKVAQMTNDALSSYAVTPEDFGFELTSIDGIKENEIKEHNLDSFIKLLSGNGNRTLRQLVSMEVALNLYNLGIVGDLKSGAKLALATIDSGGGIDVLNDLVNQSGGDKDKFHNLLNRFTK